jgi:tetratricopeptide (TPR) repeat protein
VFHSIGKIDKAMENLDAAVALAPQTPQKDSAEVFANVFRNRAMLRSKTDQHEQALADIDETLRIYVAHESEVGAKTIALAHTTRARSFLCTGRNEEALAECDMALKLASASDRDAVFEIRCIRASALKELGKFRDAVSEFSTAIELGPQPDSSFWPWAHNSLAWLLATCPDSSLRDAPRAVQLGKQAVALAPDNNSYWSTLGVAEYRNGEWASAVTSLKKSVALGGSGKASGEFFLAMAHWQLDKHEEARRWYEEAVATMKQEDEHDEDLTRFCAEATETLEIEARH